ncbi:SIR2 family NAD-dependent protein deacylase [Herpetosiphon giganteus]|uniref:SIR2 family NAD-dependent protein deacylase n=1 Tax=Herpetosiphon giganteus TaxID=2029754 RepID=UPI00195F02B3|nr:NAD-dependent deacylase [Herpetosiphon giganteus]MBM7844382.1 NAD-dependent deacetylase [Herpetosiphon giganteus]
MTELFDQGLIETLRAARSLTILTGAGMSAESGIPTFRDSLTGLWNTFDIEQVASLAGYLQQPKAVWEWYHTHRQQILAVQPNAGHRALAQLEQYIPKVTLITQNIDALHQRAGSSTVIELHGTIDTIRCSAGDHGISAWPDSSSLPLCAICGAPLRPDVVWFGERLDLAKLQAAEVASQTCDVFLAIGTSGLVAPAATFPMTARAHRARLIDLNLEDTPLSRHARHRLRGPAAQLLPALVAATWPEA